MDIFQAKKIKPMLATRSQPFSSPEYLFEIKWDGIRCLAYLNGETNLRSRNNLILNAGYPELVNMHTWMKGKELILDGEIVVMKAGKPSFHEWQKRSRLGDYKQLERLAKTNPAVYIIFDILYLDGQNLMPLPLIERKQILLQKVNEQTSLVVSRYIMQEGEQFYKAAVEQELEGVVAKKTDSPYLAGKRTDYWLKFKRVQQEDFVICGYLPGQNDGLGSLVLGAYQGAQLFFQGLVGTGMDGKNRAYLLDYLNHLKTNNYPFQFRIKEIRRGIWVKPELVCTVEYLERSSGGLRHPTFRGLRTDKDPSECKW